MPVRLSVNDASAPTGLLLLNVNCTVEVPPSGIVVGLNAFAIVAIVALIFLGGQVSQILSSVGNSV